MRRMRQVLTPIRRAVALFPAAAVIVSAAVLAGVSTSSTDARSGASLIEEAPRGVTNTGPREAAPGGPLAQEDVAAVAVREVAKWLGVPEAQLEADLVFEPTVAGPERYWAANVLDLGTGEFHQVVFNAATGQAYTTHDFEKLQSAAHAKLTPQEQKIDLPFREVLATATSGTAFDVGVWFTADLDGLASEIAREYGSVEAVGPRLVAIPGKISYEDFEAILNDLLARRAKRIADASAPIRERFEALGGRFDYVSTVSPVLLGRMGPAALLELANEPRVTRIAIQGEGAVTMNAARPTVQSTATPGCSGCYGGAGVDVAVIEYENFRETGDLAGKLYASYNASGQLRYDDDGLDHPTWVAGAIAGQGATYYGIAPLARLLSGGTRLLSPGWSRDADVIKAADWAASHPTYKAEVINTSLVQDSSSGQTVAEIYFDDLVWSTQTLSVTAAGNWSTKGTWYVGSPGTAWNPLTVGGMEDKDDSTWSNDELWYDSTPAADCANDGAAFRNPDKGIGSPDDLEKPEVSAPAHGGSGFTTVRTANGEAWCGTSVATPIVSGIVAQLYGRDLTTFRSWPELAKTIVISGAIHRTPLTVGEPPDQSHEGYGTVSAEWVHDTWTYGYVGKKSWAGRYIPGEGSLPPASFTIPVWASSGQNVRFALCWNSHAVWNGAYQPPAGTDFLATDVNLSAKGSDGSIADTSNALEASCEFLQWVGNSSTVTVTVSAARWTSTVALEPIAWAWTRWTTP